jgi:hypothetical protein
MLSNAERAVAHRVDPHVPHDFGAGEPNILELTVAHRPKLGNRRLLDAPGYVGYPPAPQSGNQSTSPGFPCNCLRRSRRVENGAHDDFVSVFLVEFAQADLVRFGAPSFLGRAIGYVDLSEKNGK